jgi:hypothetical protein
MLAGARDQPALPVFLPREQLRDAGHPIGGLVPVVKLQPEVADATTAGVITSSPAGFAPVRTQFARSLNAISCSGIVKPQWRTSRMERSTRRGYGCGA